MLCTKYMASSEVMTSSTHSFAYSYRLVKKCFVKMCETSKCHNFLIFQPIFIKFSLLCLKFFTLSFKLKLNLLWSSSLIMLKPCKLINDFLLISYRNCKNTRMRMWAFFRFTFENATSLLTSCRLVVLIRLVKLSQIILRIFFQKYT